MEFLPDHSPDPAPSDLTASDVALPDLALPGLIHDLNNVFQTLMEAADQLSEDPRWAPLSAAIFRSIERGRDIALSMQVANHPAAPFETVLEKAMTFVQDSVALQHGPEIRFTLDLTPGIVLRHPRAWERVLINLFLNSVSAMPQGGAISIQTRQQKGATAIVVADEGLGIAPELLPHVFQPDVSTKTGGGLGLHIVRSIVEQEDGGVHAANRQGGGAEFTITIPAQTLIARGAGA